MCAEVDWLWCLWNKSTFTFEKCPMKLPIKNPTVIWDVSLLVVWRNIQVEGNSMKVPAQLEEQKKNNNNNEARSKETLYIPRRIMFFSGDGNPWLQRSLGHVICVCPMQLHTLMGCDINQSQSIDVRFPKGNSKPQRYQSTLLSRFFTVKYCLCLLYFL